VTAVSLKKIQRFNQVVNYGGELSASCPGRFNSAEVGPVSNGEEAGCVPEAGMEES
jgi:hypothetical protein